MKTLLVLLATMFVTVTNPDDIVGVWTNGSGSGRIQIYKEGNKYFGKIIWLKDPNNAQGKPKSDAQNPDESQRNKPLLGAVVLRNFVYNDGEWTGGRIYDPQNGKDYKCYLKLKDANTLNVRGYIGISLLGRTEVWSRR
jgi:uncharacterized protein (DUF2147 family)